MTWDQSKMNNPLPTGGAPSVFDPNEFSTPVEGVGSTTITVIPTGEYLALIGGDENSVKPVPYSDQKTNQMKLRLDVTFELLDDTGAIRAAIDGRDPKHTQGFFVDLIPGTWKFDMGKGKNVSLNKLREAVGQNTGAPWVYTMLRGAGPIKLHIVAEPDRQDPTIPRNRIKAFGKPA